MSEITQIVYIVDDDVSVRESLELLVRCAGYHAETFASALAFLSHPRAAVPSCLVLDIGLPGLNGLGLQQHLAATRNEMPIIFVTGCNDVHVTVQAMKAGAQEFLTKPFDDEVLLCAIRQAIERSQDVGPGPRCFHRRFGQELLEGYPTEVGHAEQMKPTRRVDTRRVDRHDMGVLEPCQRLRLLEFGRRIHRGFCIRSEGRAGVLGSPPVRAPGRARHQLAAADPRAIRERVGVPVGREGSAGG